jgi:membrane protease YdiL (CAAX protease family)
LLTALNTCQYHNVQVILAAAPTGIGKTTLLALAFGVLTDSNKAFEIVYVLWMYLILNKVAAIDFLGMTPRSPWLIYLGLALVLLTVSAVSRQIQMKSRQLVETTILKKRAFLYLGILYGFLILGWLATVLLPDAYTVLWGLFSLLPILATFLTRLLTKDKSPWYLKSNFRKSWKNYLFAAFAPGAAIFLGGLLYFTLFPQDLDLGAHNLIAQYGQYGAPDTIHFTVRTIILIGLAFIIISPLVLPVYIFALGEEIGWRGYLLPILLKLTSPHKAVLLHGVLWGLAHAPLIYFGFNYGSEYWGAPWSGIVMMTLVGMVLGTWLGYVTIRSESILPAVILHGASNVIGEMAALVSFLNISPLLGPNPTGLIGMSGLLVGAMFLLTKLEGKRS